MKLFELLQAVKNGLLLQFPYIKRAASSHKSVAEKYPDAISGRSASDMFPSYKGYLRNDLNKCSGCGVCLNTCPVTALSMDTESRQDGSYAVKNFRIHLGRCFSCGICVESCPESSLFHSRDFELVTEKSKDLIVVSYASEKRGNEQNRIRTYEVRR